MPQIQQGLWSSDIVCPWCRHHYLHLRGRELDGERSLTSWGQRVLRGGAGWEPASAWGPTAASHGLTPLPDSGGHPPEGETGEMLAGQDRRRGACSARGDGGDVLISACPSHACWSPTLASSSEEGER